jgi:high affinity cGMP-specific 3',5'-cyclic phosphodiesterase 9
VFAGHQKQKTLQNWLEQAGYKCLVGTTVENAWQELQDVAAGVAVVVTDAGMHQKWNEIGLKDHIQKKNVSVIMIGASEGVEHGSYAFIAKPLVKEVLLQRVEMLIHHREAEVDDRKDNVAMRKEIAKLSERVLHTPVQIIVDSIAELLEASELSVGLRKKIESLRGLIVQNSNLYRPTVPEQTDFDPVTRSFLFNELSLFVPESEFSQSFPVIHANDPIMLQLTQWTFNGFEHSDDEMLALAKQMFVHLDLLNHFNIRGDVMERFLLGIRQLYKQNPYHNWLHAFDVTQATFCFLVHFEGLTKLSRLDWLALLVAALCHDLGHPGVNNAHLVAIQAELAVRYNDRSALENFHAASLFELLQQRDDLNIFATLTRQQFRDVRKSITDCILATDMANHYEYVAKLLLKAESGRPEWNCTDPGQRSFLMQCIIKMADINNVARPWDVSLEWSRRVTEEFFAQGTCALVFLFFVLMSSSCQVTQKDQWDRRLLPFLIATPQIPLQTASISLTFLHCLFSQTLESWMPSSMTRLCLSF